MTEYVLQVQWDYRQWLIGFYWSKNNKLIYLGPLSLRLHRIPTFEDFFEGLEGEVKTGHEYVPLEGQPGKFECVHCGEIAASPELN